MRQAITTTYLGPTATRAARVKAQARGGSVVLPWDNELGEDENYMHAAMTLLQKLGWEYDSLHGGVTHRGEIVWVIHKE